MPARKRAEIRNPLTACCWQKLRCRTCGDYMRLFAHDRNSGEATVAKKCHFCREYGLIHMGTIYGSTVQSLPQVLRERNPYRDWVLVNRTHGGGQGKHHPQRGRRPSAALVEFMGSFQALAIGEEMFAMRHVGESRSLPAFGQALREYLRSGGHKARLDMDKARDGFVVTKLAKQVTQ